jgi:hypothetical protein
MLRRVLPAVVCGTLMIAAAAMGQEPKTEAAALSSAIALLRGRPTTPDFRPIVTDSAALHRELVRCEPTSAGKTECSFVDGKVVAMVTARLSNPETAHVEVRYYQVMRTTCPLGTPLDAPIISYPKWESFTLSYADGKWGRVGVGSVRMC